MDMHLKINKTILFIKSVGTGKIAVIKDYLAQTKPEQVAQKTIVISSFTDFLAL